MEISLNSHHLAEEEREREMARFAVGGDEDGNEDRPTTRPLPKRPRISETILSKRPTAAASTSAAAAAAPAPPPQTERIRRIEVEVVTAGGETTDESESSWSDSVSDSSSEESAEEEEEEEEENVQPQPTQRSAVEVQPVEARAVPVASGSDAGREPDGSISVTLTDPDVLDCPICYEPLCSPVYQCENGHIACASCCTTMKNKCASCCWPIGYSRCRAIEKVLEAVRIACRNKPRGCRETFSYNKRLAHEKICTYACCSCPYIGCDFSSNSKIVYAHFGIKHSESSKPFRFNEVVSLSLEKTQKQVFFQEKNLSTIFILNRSVETVGSFLNVVCVAPLSERRAYMYDLAATDGESTIRLKSVVDVMPKWMGHPPMNVYLIVPSIFSGIIGRLRLELKVWKNPVNHG